VNSKYSDFIIIINEYPEAGLTAFIFVPHMPVISGIPCQ